MNAKSDRSIWKRLNEFDRRISEPIFAARLPFAFLEYLLSIPGNWFGSCSFASATLPSLLGIFCDGGIAEWHPWHGLVAGLIAFNLTIWTLLLSPKKSAISRRARIIFYGPLTGAVGPIIGVTVLAMSPLSTMAKNVGYFQICSWSIGVIPTACLKPLVSRQRPASWILLKNDATTSDDEDRVNRLQKAAKEKHINTLPKLFTLDANHSFPSGDTAGALSSMYTLIFLDHVYPSSSSLGVRIVGIILVLLSCFGRMYWMAHHLLDVSVGVLAAYFPLVLLERMFCDERGCNMEWWVPLVGHFILLVTVIVTRAMFSSKKGVFAAGSIRVDGESGDEDDSAKGTKQE
ncbi:MAG: hypothetical protein SGBAC_011893 [Bacillariaceae sp.]